jgi:hypothetical protein
MAKYESTLEAEAAEFLALGSLLLERLVAHNNDTKIPGYDLAATDPEVTSSVTIQVKSQWATDQDKGFVIKGMDCDFLVFVALNRGYRSAEKRVSCDDGGVREPDFYVLPAAVIENAPLEKKLGKLFIRTIHEYQTYRGAWHLIKTRLSEAG